METNSECYIIFIHEVINKSLNFESASNITVADSVDITL